ncbi:MAG: hypothetical protein M5U34_12715 [Chloroflexi bacterium]|nr:hypothetical protein [Chloroflexota bacterium]
MTVTTPGFVFKGGKGRITLQRCNLWYSFLDELDCWQTAVFPSHIMLAVGGVWGGVAHADAVCAHPGSAAAGGAGGFAFTCDADCFLASKGHFDLDQHKRYPHFHSHHYI